MLAPESSTNTHAGWYATPKCAHSEPSSVTAWGNPSPYSSTNARMFAAAGYPSAGSGQLPPELLDNLAVWGNVDEIPERLTALLDSGLDELLVTSVPVGNPASDEARLLRVLGGM